MSGLAVNPRPNLERLAPYLRCPECHAAPLAFSPEAADCALRCAACGGVFPCRDGILDLLAARDAALAGQAFGRFEAWSYDTFAARGGFRRLYRGRLEDEVREFTRPFELMPDDTVVDAGCGTGNYTLEFARAVPHGLAVGIDLSWSMLEYFRRHAVETGAGNVVLLRANALNLPFRDGSVPRLFCGCLHHFADLCSPLAEAFRCLAPGGTLFGGTIFPYRAAVAQALLRLSVRFQKSRVVEPAALSAVLKQAGFARVEVDRTPRAFFFGTYKAVRV